MNAEWLGAIAGAAGVVVAAVSGGFAGRANRIAKDAQRAAADALAEAREANQLAAEANDIAAGAAAVSETALDLQKRIDDRQAEFEDVRWDCWVNNSGGASRFEIRNEGLTSARDARVAIDLVGDQRQLLRLGDFAAGESKSVDLGVDLSPADNARTSWTIYWRSELGNAHSKSAPGLQIF